MDLQQAFDEGFDVLKGYVDRSFDAYAKRIDALEAKLAVLPVSKAADETASIPVAKDSVPVTIEDVTQLIRSEVAKLANEAIQRLPDMVQAAVATMPPPAPGKDADPEVVKAMVADAVAAAVAAVPPAAPGRDADPEQVAAMVKAEAERILSTWERPKDGNSVSVDDVTPIIADAVSKAVATIPVPKDGCGIRDLLIDRHGALVATMEDGRVKELGRVVGTDGRDADMAALERKAIEMIAALPKPRDGVDGIGFDDMDLVETDDGVHLRFLRGEKVKDFRLPIVIDRGVWHEGTYRKGDGVTWGGSFWIAQTETSEKPDGGKGWRLSVKKGRDGRDGTIKAPNEPKPIKVG